MKTFIRFFFLFFIIGLSYSLSQDQWNYTGKLTFPSADTAYVRPYLCCMDKNGILWVTSSSSVDTAAHNAIFKLDPGQTQFTKWIDFTAEQSTIVGKLRSITASNDALYVCAEWYGDKMGQYGVIYKFKNFSKTDKEIYGASSIGSPVIAGSGYGTQMFCLASSIDNFVYAGLGFRNTTRVYNFNKDGIVNVYGNIIAYGSGISYPDWGSSSANIPVDAFGPSTGGSDLLRDISLIPGRNYNDSTKAEFYTSRNSAATAPTGGITIWSGGKILNMATYKTQKVLDAAGALSFSTFSPYGITVDNVEQLWVAGPDSTRKWVKYFQMAGNFAMEMGELPSKTNPLNPNLSGAPFNSPNDIALSPDNKTAYVIDLLGRCAYKFTYGPAVSVNDKNKLPENILLNQNYPNPFNPSTIISFEIPKSMLITLKVYNYLGQEVSSLLNEYKNAGKHSVVFRADNLPTGVYSYKLTAGDNIISKKMLFVK